jgi:tetratricopeptide (TPR) repeat protein
MSTVAFDPPPSPIEAEVRRIRKLLEDGEFAQALWAADMLLLEVPENRDVLYMVAVSQRYLRRIPHALATLARLETLHPAYGRLFQERGHCYRTLGDVPAAITAYRHAVQLNSALPASWKALQILHWSLGQQADSETAGNHVASLVKLPAEVVTASSLFADGDIFDAERLIRQFLLTQPDHIEAMRLLAQIGMKLDVLDDAEFLLESVVTFAPDYHLARYEYAVVLSQRHKHAQALKEARRLIAIEPTHRAYRTIRATACTGLGDHEGALQIYRELSAEAPQTPDLHLSIAHALKTLGRQQEAIVSYRTAAAVKPNYGDAYWSLANLKTYRFTDDELARMRAEEVADTTPLVDRYHLCFALGKALEDRAEYAASFEYYERGNALKKSECRYKPGLIERNARLQASVCTREFFESRRGVGCDRADPIFIVGLPRAGSTLLEQILASHSKVEGTMELADIPRLVHHLQGREQDDSKLRYPAVLAELTAEQLTRLGEKYLTDTQVYRTGHSATDLAAADLAEPGSPGTGRPTAAWPNRDVDERNTGRPEMGQSEFFIDKMPNNFRHIGLIHLILPNARIIDARREPMACCFSNFKQLFASGQEFTYSLEDIGRYYRSYVELMAHWDAVLPGKILRVQHEEVVEDLEGNVRRLLEFCGLEFEPQCLEFYKTGRSVRTASSEQVRQPIFKDGLDQWRHFEPWLEPLKEALGPLATPAPSQSNS